MRVRDASGASNAVKNLRRGAPPARAGTYIPGNQWATYYFLGSFPSASTRLYSDTSLNSGKSFQRQQKVKTVQ